MARLKEKYNAEVAPALMKQFGYKSVMQLPKIDKVVVNVGCGEARENAKILENVVGDLAQITGQKPVITRARKSIANFKLREEMPIGAKVTLRGEKSGNYALGIKEQLIFPEIEYDKIDKIRGMDVVICTTAHTDEEARALLEQVIFPEIEYDKIDKIRGMDVVICTTAHTDEEARALLEQVGAPFAR